jgi:hypothetical protein
MCYIIPFPDVCRIRYYEEGLEVQDSIICTFQIQEVEQEWTIEEPKLSDKGRSPSNMPPNTIC